jgi:hypothetical protein
MRAGGLLLRNVARRLQFEADSALYCAKAGGRNRWSLTNAERNSRNAPEPLLHETEIVIGRDCR